MRYMIIVFYKWSMRYMVTEKVPKVLFPLRALFKFWFVDVLNMLALAPFKVNKPISLSR